MMRPRERQALRRIFAETLTKVSRTYAPMEEGMVEARAPNAAGVLVVVARYKLFRDGSFQCFEVLDDVLWPALAEGDPARGGDRQSPDC